MKNYCFLPIDEKVALVQPALDMAEEIFRLVDSDREHLRPFLDFVDATKEVQDEYNYLEFKLSSYLKGTDCLYLIAYEGKLVGSIDLHFINSNTKKAEIGYWLHSSVTGKGTVTKCVKKICQIAFENFQLNKLVIVADTENEPSNKVALNAGFSFICTDPQDMVLYGEFRDMNKYVLLKSDFVKTKLELIE